MARTLLPWALLLLAALSCVASQNTVLTWDASPDTNVIGYKVCYGGASGVYTNSVVLGNVTNATIAGLTEGATYFFAAKGVSASGAETPFSNEASYQAPLAVTNSGGGGTTVPPGNYQPPTLNPIADVTVYQNAGLQTLWVTGIRTGSVNGNDVPSSALTFSATSSNPSVIPTPTVSFDSPSTGAADLRFTPAPDALGTATITVTVDNGSGSNNLATQTFTVTVVAVPPVTMGPPPNQPPTLDPITNLTLIQGAAARTITLTGISSGSPTESQTLRVSAVTSNARVLPTPTIRYTSPGTTAQLTLNPSRSVTGTAVITVTVNDGGASNNIVRRSFTVTVVPKQRQVIQRSAAAVTNPSTTSASVSVGIVPSNAAAELTAAAAPSGQFSFRVNGISGARYAVQVTADLTHWTTLATNVAPFVFQDSGVGKPVQCFYRAVYVQ
ncbi:MAG TPA: fibronectin type III domain-containing protein [Verrucomicrobiae bacterium]